MRPRTINARHATSMLRRTRRPSSRTLVVLIISHAKESLTSDFIFYHLPNELLPVTAPRENGINKFSCEQVCALYTSTKRETYCFDIERILKKSIEILLTDKKNLLARAIAKFISNKIFPFERLPRIEQLNSYTRTHRIVLDRMHRATAFANIIFAFAYKSG